ncbi:hypothetical protein D3C72_2513580 [compost metagenome]
MPLRKELSTSDATISGVGSTEAESRRKTSFTASTIMPTVRPPIVATMIRVPLVASVTGS